MDSGDDALIADGSPVLVSTAAPLQIGDQTWRAIRGLSGIAGWVPGSQVAVDGEAAPVQVGVAATLSSDGQPGALANTQPNSVGANAQPTSLAQRGAISNTDQHASGQRASIANTDGAGVVLRNSPNDADRTRSGLMDGAAVTVLERSGNEWVRVRADNGLTGWISLRYLVGN
jgi:SH3-like domain-containing protein